MNIKRDRLQGLLCCCFGVGEAILTIGIVTCFQVVMLFVRFAAVSPPPILTSSRERGEPGSASALSNLT